MAAVSNLILRCAAWMLLRKSSLGQVMALLTRLECGVFWFCWRRSRETENPALRYTLEAQARSEFHHAQLLSQFAEGLSDDFRWLLSKSALEIIQRANEAPEITEWGGVGDENFDGISRRSLVARIFFGNRTADSYPWTDRLAYMEVLERFQASFYKELGNLLPEGDEKSTITRIAREEELHAEALVAETMISDFSPIPEMAIARWEERLWRAIAVFILSGARI